MQPYLNSLGFSKTLPLCSDKYPTVFWLSNNGLIPDVTRHICLSLVFPHITTIIINITVPNTKLITDPPQKVVHHDDEIPFSQLSDDDLN